MSGVIGNDFMRVRIFSPNAKSGMTYQRSGMWGFVGETIGECRNVNLMDQKVIPDEANKNKQKWNVNKITFLRKKVPPVSYFNFMFLPVIYQLLLPVECYLWILPVYLILG
jgi:hypothetical protein